MPLLEKNDIIHPGAFAGNRDFNPSFQSTCDLKKESSNNGLVGADGFLTISGSK